MTGAAQDDLGDGPLPGGAALTARDPAFRDAPHGVYDRLRRRAAATPDPAWGRLLVCRYADVRGALRHKGMSVDARRAREGSYFRRIAGTGVVESRGDAAYTPPLVLLDPPDHRRLRRLVSRAFEARAMAAWAPRVEGTARTLLDGLGGRDRFDFVEAFAGPLPTLVIMELMGLRDDAPWQDMKRWSEDVLWGYDPDRDADRQARLRAGFLDMGAVFRRAVAARRRRPGDDLISELVAAREDDERLSDLEIVSLCTQLMVAGNVTTTDLMANGLHALFAHPEALAALRADPARAGDAVEEMLRFDPPITETARVSVEDTRVGDCPVRAGDTLTLSLAAANRDPERFQDPHRFRLDRGAFEHLGFGTGPHVCLGAALARLEAGTAFRLLFERMPDLAPDLTLAPRRRGLPFFRGFETLPVRRSGVSPGRTPPGPGGTAAPS